MDTDKHGLAGIIILNLKGDSPQPKSPLTHPSPPGWGRGMGWGGNRIGLEKSLNLS